MKTEMTLLIGVDVHKTPTNEVEDDAWMPSDREVAAFIQERLSHVETDAGWFIGMVTAGKVD